MLRRAVHRRAPQKRCFPPNHTKKGPKTVFQNPLFDSPWPIGGNFLIYGLVWTDTRSSSFFQPIIRISWKNSENSWIPTGYACARCRPPKKNLFSEFEVLCTSSTVMYRAPWHLFLISHEDLVSIAAFTRPPTGAPRDVFSPLRRSSCPRTTRIC